MLHQHNDENVQSSISDFGLSIKGEEYDSKGEIYGVMPYVAPEVLLGEKFTISADIYSFGIIMTEMSTGQRPFDGYDFGLGLAVKICRGLRPEFVSGTPDCYIKLAKQCTDSVPQKRPSASEVIGIINYWIDNITTLDENEIKKQFLDADKAIKNLPIISPSHPNSMYTSKIINTQKNIKLD